MAEVKTDKVAQVTEILNLQHLQEEEQVLAGSEVNALASIALKAAKEKAKEANEPDAKAALEAFKAEEALEAAANEEVAETVFNWESAEAVAVNEAELLAKAAPGVLEAEKTFEELGVKAGAKKAGSPSAQEPEARLARAIEAAAKEAEVISAEEAKALVHDATAGNVKKVKSIERIMKSHHLGNLPHDYTNEELEAGADRDDTGFRSGSGSSSGSKPSSSSGSSEPSSDSTPGSGSSDPSFRLHDEDASICVVGRTMPDKVDKEAFSDSV